MEWRLEVYSERMKAGAGEAGEGERVVFWEGEIAGGETRAK